ncbi:family 1 glycosylhydrolase [Geomonas azotofigens]|uniref:family 1 glycosylhydrolase n=1 Tax=Geomonas azotofigens TaxID=2843196 RepID=UPI001C0FB79C|nr:family 1 glycosylhydrolase [Geomonas azotofigens]MBU5611778.1 sugar nucleotide-binding protein [Geomonas azotofigens]
MTGSGGRRLFPELWGGVECTLNRIGERFHSQIELNGHLARPGDLELFATLGITALRYPVLWEMVAPDSLDRPDWSFSDERLPLLRGLGIEPIVGFLHHGSGPRYTSLTDPAFASLLARYAGMVAARYPWLTSFTPVNEPLTTARFSCLYGHWYPHGRDDRSFVAAVLSQCRGIVEAMRAIRRVIPAARLVMTEDMGRTSSTRELAYQADYENSRRWLSLDLLAGRVDRDHPLRLWLSQNGTTEDDFDYFQRCDMPPDLIGLNYYLTSDRHLDERLERYPAQTHGGNHRHRYADVEAVRACPEGILGHEGVLRAAWLRYRREVALTEVHAGATREDQLRWFHEAWQAALKLCREGVPVRAVTSWALLGSFDWSGLLTSMDGRYEPGVFDVSGPTPRPTALATALQQVSLVGQLFHPTLTRPGWWRRPGRLLAGCAPRHATPDPPLPESGGVVVIGKTGTLGQAFSLVCANRGLPCHLLSRAELDITSRVSVAAALERFAPWAVINAAGFVRIDEAEGDAVTCFRQNALGPGILAAECARRGIALVTFSSDMVFDGSKKTPYHETDPVAPLNVYGRSKAEAERRVLRLHPGALLIRTSSFFGPWDRYNFVTETLRRLAQGATVRAASDLVVSPTYVPDLVHACLDLLVDAARGIWHVSNQGAVTWAELATCCATMAGFDPAAVLPRPASTLGWIAPRPPFSALASERWAALPPLQDALTRYLRDAAPDLPAQQLERAGSGDTKKGP